MDILRTRCGEPWDIYSLTNDMTKEESTKLKAGLGCPCCDGKEPCTEPDWCDDCDRFINFRCSAGKFRPTNPTGREAQDIMASILGDDIDGLAAMMDDFNLL